jgi:hypothetical protein
MANIMLGKEAEVKLSQIPLSNDTISDRIEDMSKDKDTSSCRSDFKPGKIQPSTRRDHRRFQSKPACCIRALCERRRDEIFFIL